MSKQEETLKETLEDNASEETVEEPDKQKETPEETQEEVKTKEEEEEIILITDEDLESIPEPQKKPLAESELIVIDEAELESVPEYPDVQAMKASVDIILLMDISGSMGANDYQPNRLEAAKKAAQEFARRKIIKRYKDRVGVIVFGGSPNTVQPLTTDITQVQKAVSNIKNLTHTGTYLGPAIQDAVKELETAGGKKRAIVLLSDGADEYDKSNPVGVAQNLQNIKIFTIGIGTPKGGIANLPHGQQKVVLNEEVLKRIAKVTGGKYYYAPGVEELKEIYTALADF